MAGIRLMGRYLGWLTILVMAVVTTVGFVLAAYLAKFGWAAPMTDKMNLLGRATVYLIGCLIAVSPWWALSLLLGQRSASRRRRVPFGRDAPHH